MLKKFYRNPNLICISINVFVITVLLLISNKFPPQIPIFYGKPSGEEQLGAWILILVPPSMAVFINIANEWLKFVLSNKFLSKILNGISIIVTALSTITAVQITLLIANI